MTHLTRTRLLEAGGLVIALTGALFVMSIAAPSNPLTETFFALAAWPLEGGAQLDTRVEFLLVAIAGGLTCGMGAFLFAVARGVYARDQATGGRIVTIGYLAWFVPDSIGSVMAGAGANVALNLVFLLIALGPVFWPGHEPARA